TRGALRDRRQQRDRLVPRLRKQAVAYPHRVEPGLLHRFGEVEQHRYVVVRCDQRLAIVEVDAEFEWPVAHARAPATTASSSASKNCSTSPRSAYRLIAAISPSSVARSCSPSLGTASRTAIISSASRTWYSSRNSSLESSLTTAPRRGRTVTRPSAASLLIAS